MDRGLRPCQPLARRGYSGGHGRARRGKWGHLLSAAPQGAGLSGAHRLTPGRAPAARRGSDAAVPPPRPPLTPAGPQAPPARPPPIAAAAGTHLRRRGRSGTRGLWAVNATPLRRRERPSGPGSDTGGRKRAARLRRRPCPHKGRSGACAAPPGGAAPARHGELMRWEDTSQVIKSARPPAPAALDPKPHRPNVS